MKRYWCFTCASWKGPRAADECAASDHHVVDEKAREEIGAKAAEKVEKKLFIVRLWDGFDGLWCDVTGAVPLEEAEKVWNEHTQNGTKSTKFEHIDYYKIFPADTKMQWVSGRSLFNMENRWSPSNPGGKS